LLGGREKAVQATDADLEELNRRWAQDTGTIGRILRAHLFVEHFLTEYLQAKNPNLGSLDDARVTFAQKVALVDESRQEVAYLLPGIRRLNAIRNRIAHSLRAEVTQDDADAFSRIEPFTALRNALAKGSEHPVSSDPLDILEAFALHAGSSLHQERGQTITFLIDSRRNGWQDGRYAAPNAS
jgi:hypothetical protein